MFRICIPQGFTRVFLAHSHSTNMFLLAHSTAYHPVFLFQALTPKYVHIFRLHRINNDPHLHTETVKQNGAITYLDCQYYLPIFIT